MYGSFSFGPRDQKFRRFILREWNFRPLKVEGGGKVPSSSPFDARSPIFHLEIMLQFHGDFHHLENQVQCFVWIYYFGQVYYFWDPFIQSAGGVRLGRSCGRQVFTFCFVERCSNESHRAWNDRNSGRLSEVLNLGLIPEISESKDLSNQKRGHKREKATYSIDGTKCWAHYIVVKRT